MEITNDVVTNITPEMLEKLRELAVSKDEAKLLIASGARVCGVFERGKYSKEIFDGWLNINLRELEAANWEILALEPKEFTEDG